VVGSAAKGKLESLIRPVGRALADLGISANFFTGLGFGLSCVAAYLIAEGYIRIAALVILTAGLCDVLDGAVARAKDTVTRAGAFLDSTLDRYSEIVIFLGVVWFYVSPSSGNASPLMAAVSLAALGGSMMVSYTRARAEGVNQECKIGIAERPERFAILIAGALFGATGLRVSLWILAVVSNITAIQRMTYVMKKLSKRCVPKEGE
jgi:CDP-diacylglycerol--glycerol-3-phosphate 3-phosphatidyltransferase